ncbi:lipopolysaccharide transport periplasmic protein LptA [Endozoicomonas sp. SM1973]|uniref:Lipopolysaccharide export system protein LptA n=1 Tax=Spartinivicinus marinus TaxID=2994442 RepID=A0A853HVD6_9GAMM|nr:lipopolysaccharide transport periplasmic protein LptA [Spartinivicinus marinus]MCX4025727.1 lipopolysaccharide transport periplasmic protein LptA [Spartinivicinus marinus]NYZ65720.1 lipopolysaccharide transport periplasmic protein LptA [Spartinivicinus marinus]
MKLISNLIVGIIAISAAGLSLLSWALPNDKDKPINIKAKSADIDDKSGVYIYTGNVIITQGTIQIRGDKVTLYSDSNGINKIVAVGRPAHYREKPAENKELIKAYGRTIKYYATNEKVEVITNAKLFQEGNTFTGSQIDYFAKTQKVNAKGGKTNESRVEMVLQPRSKKKQ